MMRSGPRGVLSHVLLAAAVVLAGSTLVATPSFAQTADSARYAVAYVEVIPTSVPQATKGFQAYRQAAMGESGFVAFDLFERADRDGSLIFYLAFGLKPLI